MNVIVAVRETLMQLAPHKDESASPSFSRVQDGACHMLANRYNGIGIKYFLFPAKTIPRVSRIALMSTHFYRFDLIPSRWSILVYQ